MHGGVERGKINFPTRSYFSLLDACLLRILKALKTFIFMS